MLSHNPQAMYNGYISTMRNQFLTSSIGIGGLAFSKNFKEFKVGIVIISVIILVYSAFTGYQGTRIFTKYCETLDQHEDLDKPYTILLPEWRKFITLAYIYITITLIIALLILTRIVFKNRG